MIYRIVSSVNDDTLANLIGIRNDQLCEGEQYETLVTHHSERLLLGGTFEELRKYFDEELSSLRSNIASITADHEDEVIIELGYSMTALYAAYYAVLNSPNVTINVHTPPAFGGETRYAKMHLHVIQKLVYNVLSKARKIVLPTDDSLQAILDVYPRLQGDERFQVRALPLPDEFMPIYSYVRDGIAIFANFERGGGIDDAIQAWIKLVNLYPQQFKDRSVTICGVGDHKQAADIAVAFPSWKVALNPPINKMLEVACQAEAVVMPDQPPHAGPTKELFTAIGAWAAIIAHEGSAAGDYAGRGVVHFTAEGERPLALANALLRALGDPTRTGALMAATKERRDALRNASPALYRPADLDSLVEAGKR